MPQYFLHIDLFALGAFDARLNVTNNVVTGMYAVKQPFVNLLGPTKIPLPNPAYDYSADNVFQNGKFTVVQGMNFTSLVLQTQLGQPTPYFNIYYNNDEGVNKNALWSLIDLLVDGQMPLITITLLKERPPVPVARGGRFSDNSLVFYSPHSLSTGSGASGVRNSRVKQRRT